MSARKGPDIPVFRPGKDGLEKTLGNLEVQIMDAVWSADGEVSVQDVQETLAQSGKQAAYTTVMTTLSRLHKKGFLARAMRGKAYHYTARVSRSELSDTVTRQVVDGLLSTFAEPAMSYFVEALSENDPGKLDSLAALIEKKRREQKG